MRPTPKPKKKKFGEKTFLNRQFLPTLSRSFSGLGTDSSCCCEGNPVVLYRMPLVTYLGGLMSYEHQVLTLQSLIRPFALDTGAWTCAEEASSNLLVGVFCEALWEEVGDSGWVDPLKVASVAYSLGFEPAGLFLDEAPQILASLLFHCGKLEDLLY